MAQTRAQIASLLEEHGLSPRKRFGQNFLIDGNLVAKLVDAAGLVPGEQVLEVGPGTGTLTEDLLEAGAKVLACELDRGMAALLQTRFAEPGSRWYSPAFSLVQGDCMAGKRALSPALHEALGNRPFVMVANLPYNIATPLTMTLLTAYPACRGMYVTIQREVGERLTAGPGTKAYGAIGVVCDALAKVRTLATLGPACFWPRPEVTSVMLSIERLAQPLVEPDRAVAFGAFVTRLFASRRKQLGSVLKAMGDGTMIDPDALPAGIERSTRAEALSTAQCVSLFEMIENRT